MGSVVDRYAAHTYTALLIFLGLPVGFTTDLSGMTRVNWSEQLGSIGALKVTKRRLCERH